MKSFYAITLFAITLACTTKEPEKPMNNPFVVGLNEPVDYAQVSAQDVEAYARLTVDNAVVAADAIKNTTDPTFENVFAALDDIYNNMYIASNNCFMLYWVSPDSATRANGLAGYQLIDSLSTSLYSDKAIFNNMKAFESSPDYAALSGHRKIMVDDLIMAFKQSGVNLNDADLAKYKELVKEISQLTSDYSSNMNTANEVLVLDEAGAAGLPENFKTTYKTDDNRYEIPAINATNDPLMKNAASEETRKAYYMKFYNRAADKNLAVLESLVQKRYELAQLLGYKSYAAYNLEPKMAKNPETVWAFLNDLIARTTEKATSDLAELNATKSAALSDENAGDIQGWDIAYYHNQILKNKFDVDHEKIREYLPMDECLAGVFDIYQELLGLQFKKVENGSVWHEDVTMYEVYEGEKLKGRFYLDLYPRPNKETWFYGVQISSGKATANGYQVPASLLLGNFTAPTESLPSLLSYQELNTLFHEFGHIMDGMSYEGEFAMQADAKSDFVEAMSQIFENWIDDYEMLSKFAKHYQTGEVLPKELFDNMINAKNVASGYFALSQLRKCVYDMNLYDLYNPNEKLDTDELWRKIDAELGIPMDVEGTHYQASWIHINTHPVYYYGYLWSEVYAQDMFTQFEEHGLLDQTTGLRYRKLILSNGKQRDIVAAVEEFLGRKSNNEAYIKSLGLK